MAGAKIMVLSSVGARFMAIADAWRRAVKDRERVVLTHLDDELWLRPMDVGGRDGSHHSTTLARLARAGLAERKKSCDCGPGSWRERQLLAAGKTPLWPWCRCKGSCRYRRTPAGAAALLERNFGGAR